MRRTAAKRNVQGVGQLSLVEHALCPLDSRRSLVENLVFDTSYAYSTGDAVRKTSQVRVFCPLGLSAADELYLWGLLALTLLQPEPEPELYATPHWCLRQLGVINQGSKRGGRQYRQFHDAIQRLSTVTYMSNAFYDQIRGEHRRVSFRFFSYSLPVDDDSDRAWRIAWDPIFFELAKGPAGHFRFDLAVYRELDAASRRLFLFASKVLSRRANLKALRLEHLAVDLMGFSPTLAVREMKAKVGKCLRKLVELHVLADAEVFRTSPGNYFVKFARGPYFDARPRRAAEISPHETPIFETLTAIGLDEAAAARLIRRYPQRLLAEWADITQAAKERYGAQFFRKSPMAYFVDSVSKAATGARTAPDWWQELKRSERRQHELSSEGVAVISRIREELFGPSPIHAASEAAAPRPRLTRAADVLAARDSA
ncbi:MAG: hypothetical protein KF861_11895 [Planctomycetaceae bacterium]|nr:hypothetical protein [Planctomycetaceae bacterium]